MLQEKRGRSTDANLKTVRANFLTNYTVREYGG